MSSMNVINTDLLLFEAVESSKINMASFWPFMIMLFDSLIAVMLTIYLSIKVEGRNVNTIIRPFSAKVVLI